MGAATLETGSLDPVGHDGIQAQRRRRERSSEVGVACALGNSDETGRAQRDLSGVWQKCTGVTPLGSLFKFPSVQESMLPESRDAA